MNRITAGLLSAVACMLGVSSPADAAVIRPQGLQISDRLQTKAIQTAIDAASAAGGGEVVIPAGTYRTGGLVLRSGVTLRLEEGAELEGSRDERDYPGGRRWFRGLIRADSARDVAIVGGRHSRINGMNCYDARGEEGYRGPHGILLENCTNVVLRGYVIKDSGNWAHALFHCANVKVEDIRVYGGHDALDFHDSSFVDVRNCEFHTGDDCIAGYANYRCTVRDCVLDTSCQAVRMGGAELLFERCRMPAESTYGHRYGLTKEQKERSDTCGEKAKHGANVAVVYYCDTRWNVDRPQRDVVFRDCEFLNCNQAFAYNFDGRDMWCCIHPLESIAFERCRFTGLRRPVAVYSDSEKPLELSFRGCTFAAAGGAGDRPVASVYQHKRLELTDCAFSGFDRPHVVMRSSGEVALKGAHVPEKRFAPDPADEIFTFGKAAEALAKLPSDEKAWRDWAAKIPTPSEKRWNGELDFYALADRPLERDVVGSVLAVFRGETPHAAAISKRSFRLFRYLAGWNLTGQVVLPDGSTSTLPAGPFAYTLARANPLFARAFITDFLRRTDVTPAARAGMKLALAKIMKEIAIVGCTGVAERGSRCRIASYNLRFDIANDKGDNAWCHRRDRIVRERKVCARYFSKWYVKPNRAVKSRC